MNEKDIKEFHNLDRLKEYRPLPSGIVVADSGIAGQGLFTTRRLVMGTTLGISHYRIDGEYIRVKPGFDKWSIMTLDDIEEGCELTLKYKLYDPKKI